MIAPAGYLLRERGEFGGSDLPILTVVSEYGVRIRDLEAGGRAVSEDLAGYRRVRQGDLVVNRLWARFGAYGVSEFDGLISPAYWILQPDSSKVDGRFLHSLLRSSRYLAEIQRLSKDMPPNGFDLPWDLFKRLHLNLPSLPAQRAIADYLDAETERIDVLIEKKQGMVKLLEEFHTARVSAQISGGEQVALSATADDWFPGLPNGWRVSSVSGVTHAILDGPHTSPTYVEPSEGVPFISVRNISLLGWDLSSAKYISRTDYETFSRRVKPEIGDVLLTKGGNTGIARVVDLTFDFHVWVHVAILKVDHSAIRPHFLAAVLNSMPGYAQSQLGTRGATNQDLVLGRIAKIRVPLPSLSEQDRIIQMIEDFSVPVRKAALNLSQQIELLREHRQALITAAVTGELEIPGVAA